ncbi:MAG: hypothetical protein QOE13_1885, partial [Gaiellaceae bacterium]|nr:hypothetical protein [Gaiellaceae bacterium]
MNATGPSVRKPKGVSPGVTVAFGVVALFAWV